MLEYQKIPSGIKLTQNTKTGQPGEEEAQTIPQLNYKL